MDGDAITRCGAEDEPRPGPPAGGDLAGLVLAKLDAIEGRLAGIEQAVLALADGVGTAQGQIDQLRVLQALSEWDLTEAGKRLEVMGTVQLEQTKSMVQFGRNLSLLIEQMRADINDHWWRGGDDDDE